ncbi:MAG: FHA domain-containing protein [Candidatus Ancillula sp.]|nr:FHA domain-containing protein [Candidatus Ancillula sp.]
MEKELMNGDKLIFTIDGQMVYVEDSTGDFEFDEVVKNKFDKQDEELLSVVFPYETFFEDGENQIKINTGDNVPFSTLFQKGAGEGQFVVVVSGIIEALAKLMNLGIDPNLVNFNANTMYFSMQTGAVKLLMLPVKNPSPVPFDQFFIQLFEALPFVVENEKMLKIKVYLDAAKSGQIEFALAGLAGSIGIDINSSVISDKETFEESKEQPQVEKTEDISDLDISAFAPKDEVVNLNSDENTDTSEQPENSVAGKVDELDVEQKEESAKEVVEQAEEEQIDLEPKKVDKQPVGGKTKMYQATELYIDPQDQDSEKSAIAQLINDKDNTTTDIFSMPFKIGRSDDFVDLAIDNPRISSVHCRIERAVGGFMIVDLNSTNGVRINEEKISAQKPTPIKSGDKIRLADIELDFKVL